MSNANVQAIFWSSNIPLRPHITNFYNIAPNSTYIDWLAEYGVARGQHKTDYIDNNTATTVSAEQIKARLQTLVTTVPSLSTIGDTIYMIHMPPGVTTSTALGGLCQQITGGGTCTPSPGHPCQGVAVAPQALSGVQCAYHDYLTLADGRLVPFAVIPDMTDQACFNSCRPSDITTTIDATTRLASHELIEAATDPRLLTTGENEIADLCNTNDANDHARLSVGGNPAQITLPGYMVFKGWSNRNHSCVIKSPLNSVFTPAPADYDNDGRLDIAVKDDTLGLWHIDYSSNGYNGWDESHAQYGFADAHPVPADYDHDGKADLAIKRDDGAWFIDGSLDGFHGWDRQIYGFGGTDAHPVPADYDGDGFADPAVKTDGGLWRIKYSTSGIYAPIVSYGGYGPATSIAVPADYDGDHRADLSIKDSSGYWYIDYASTSFGAWDFPNTGYFGYGPASSIPAVADYDGDLLPDFAIRNSSGQLWIDLSSTGRGTWDNPQYGGFGVATPVPGKYANNTSLKADFAEFDGQTWFIDENSGVLGAMFGAWTHTYDLKNR